MILFGSGVVLFQPLEGKHCPVFGGISAEISFRIHTKMSKHSEATVTPRPAEATGTDNSDFAKPNRASSNHSQSNKTSQHKKKNNQNYTYQGSVTVKKRNNPTQNNLIISNTNNKTQSAGYANSFTHKKSFGDSKSTTNGPSTGGVLQLVTPVSADDRTRSPAMATATTAMAPKPTYSVDFLHLIGAQTMRTDGGKQSGSNNNNNSSSNSSNNHHHHGHSKLSSPQYTSNSLNRVRMQRGGMISNNGRANQNYTNNNAYSNGYGNNKWGSMNGTGQSQSRIGLNRASHSSVSPPLSTASSSSSSHSSSGRSSSNMPLMNGNRYPQQQYANQNNGNANFFYASNVYFNNGSISHPSSSYHQPQQQMYSTSNYYMANGNYQNSNRSNHNGNRKNWNSNHQRIKRNVNSNNNNGISTNNYHKNLNYANNNVNSSNSNNANINNNNNSGQSNNNAVSTITATITEDAIRLARPSSTTTTSSAETYKNTPEPDDIPAKLDNECHNDSTKEDTISSEHLADNLAADRSVSTKSTSSSSTPARDLSLSLLEASVATSIRSASVSPTPPMSLSSNASNLDCFNKNMGSSLCTMDRSGSSASSTSLDGDSSYSGPSNWLRNIFPPMTTNYLSPTHVSEEMFMQMNASMGIDNPYGMTYYNGQQNVIMTNNPYMNYQIPDYRSVRSFKSRTQSSSSHHVGPQSKRA